MILAFASNVKSIRTVYLCAFNISIDYIYWISINNKKPTKSENFSLFNEYLCACLVIYKLVLKINKTIFTG